MHESHGEWYTQRPEEGISLQPPDTSKSVIKSLHVAQVDRKTHDGSMVLYGG